ncbi:MAG: diacylglycerol kinase [Clostridia bacterium]|nr:diacylglycerol kinase [Clostridia bacterium]
MKYSLDEKLKDKNLDENLDNVHKNKTWFSATKNALNGIIHAFKTERNLRIDYLIGALVFFISLFFDFTKVELICLVITIGFVIFAEMINSVVEYVVNLITTEYNLDAKAAKDIAAGGVLIASTISVIVAYLLFIDKLKVASTELLHAVLSTRSHITVVILFVVVLLVAILKGIFTKRGERNYVKSFPSARVMISFALATYLLVITESLLVGGVAFVLSVMVSSMKRENDKTTMIQVVLSAALGILVVLALYQLTKLTPHVANWTFKLW